MGCSALSNSFEPSLGLSFIFNSTRGYLAKTTYENYSWNYDIDIIGLKNLRINPQIRQIRESSARRTQEYKFQ